MIDGRARGARVVAVTRNRIVESSPDVSHVATSEPGRSDGGNNARPPRRVFAFADDAVAALLESHLAGAGYETRASASANFDTSELGDFAPDAVVIEMRGGESERITLTHRLRADPTTYALPVVFLFHEDERMLRNAALSIGVDDYFALATPPAEMRARLDALFWRAEAGRRAAPVVGEQHAEIDNFLILLDTVRADIDDGAQGTLAIVVAEEDNADPHRPERERLLSEAHGFLKLNLRRIDTVAFYGPTMLLVYLPDMTAISARIALMRAREKFLATRRDSLISIGLASFPADGKDVENLFERAEASITKHRPPAPSTPGVAATTTSTAATASATVSAATSAATGVETPAQKPAPTPEQPATQTPTEMVAATTTPEAASDSPASHVADDATRDELADDATPAVEPSPVVASPPPPEGQTYARAPVRASSHVLRESRTDETGVLPVLVETGADTDGDRLARAAAEAGARESERRARGEVMPRRLLLTVSDPVRMAQVNLLIRAAGYEVRAAFDGQQALNLLRIERPDLLLLDYELQGIDGMETIRRLRKQNGGRLKLPVVLLLPARHDSIRHDAVEEGARAVVGIPYDPVELLDAVRTAGTSD